VTAETRGPGQGEQKVLDRREKSGGEMVMTMESQRLSTGKKLRFIDCEKRGRGRVLKGGTRAEKGKNRSNEGG